MALLLGAVHEKERGEATSCFSVAQMLCCPVLVSASGKLGRLRVLRSEKGR